MSPDPAEVLAGFAEQHGISYPLLSDVDSTVIRRIGILNTLVAPGESNYGIPFPGLYVTDATGRVTHKVFHRRYQERDTADALLHGVLGLALDMSANPSSTGGGDVRAVLGASALAFGQRSEVYVRIAAGAEAHVYGPAVPPGYIPTRVEVSAPEGLAVGPARYPSTVPFRVEGLAEDFEVFEGEPEIAVPLLSEVTQTAGEPASLRLEIRVQYQACTAHECLLPQRSTLALDVPIRGLNRPPRRS